MNTRIACIAHFQELFTNCGHKLSLSCVCMCVCMCVLCVVETSDRRLTSNEYFDISGSWYVRRFLGSKVNNGYGVICEASGDFLGCTIPTNFKNASASFICFYK